MIIWTAAITAVVTWFVQRAADRAAAARKAAAHPASTGLITGGMGR